MAVDMLVVVATTPSTANPAAGFESAGEKACRRLKKSLRDNSLCAAGVQVKACKWLLRMQGVRSKLSWVFMNSVAKGNKFEDEVFSAIGSEVTEGRLGLLEKNCNLFQKKGYYSRDRDSEIIVDISIEVWLPDAPTWSMLWVCECKDYSGSLPVDDVEEFKAKLDQIAGKNVKGLMAVTGALQRGALNFAKSNGIGVVRVLPDEQISWVMYRMTPDMLSRGLNERQFDQAFTVPRFTAENQSFFGNSDGYIFDSWRGLLRKALSSSVKT